MTDASNKSESIYDRLEDRLEAISNDVVMLEASDQKALKEVSERIETLRQCGDESGNAEIIAAIAATHDLIQQAMSDDAPQAVSSIESAGQTLSSIQEMVIHGRKADARREEGSSSSEADPGDLDENEGAASLSPYVDRQILSEFLDNQTGTLEKMEELVLAFEKGASETGLKEYKGLIHTLKGESGMMGLSDIQELCHVIEDTVDRTGAGAIAEELLRAKDWFLGKILHLSNSGDVPDPVEDLIDTLTKAETGSIEETENPNETEAGAETQDNTADAKVERAEPSENPFEGDTELLGEFVGESLEHLESADVHLLTLETEPTCEDALNAIFRAFHTIKGVAGFLELNQIRQLAHESENVLDQARKGNLVLEGQVIDLIFDSVDVLKRLISGVAESVLSGQRLTNVPEVELLIDRLKAAPNGDLPDVEGEPPSKDAPRDGKLGDLLVEAGAATPEDVTEALEKQNEPAEKKKLGEMLVEASLTSSQEVEDALLRSQAGGEGAVKTGEALVEAGKVSREGIDATLEKQKKPAEKAKLGETLVRKGKAQAKQVAKALRAQQVSRNPQAGGLQQGVMIKETIKVDAGRLDMLVDTIGELVIAESMVSQLAASGRSESTQFGTVVGQLDKITRELQGMGMSLRMVPIRPTFQKMARLARDVSKKLGKKVNFVMSGEDTELDKTVVDKIGDPLVHMVRNAIDHGLESPEERRAAGKDEIGRVELRAFHKESNVHIEIEDDGHGLNRERILKKARERGLVREGEDPTDRQLFNLILEPGFSTAKKVTDVSGRGVGLDVVKRGIESLRGRIEISSKPGEGSTFSIRLPLTLAIIDGMVVTIGSERYIIPTLSITRLIRPTPADLHSAMERGEMMMLDGELIPLFRMGDLLGVRGAKQDPCEALCVVIENEGHRAALMTDEILGQQQIVIKSLGETFHGIMGVSGGAILPDGRVGLILDVGGIIKLAHQQKCGGLSATNTKA